MKGKVAPIAAIVGVVVIALIVLFVTSGTDSDPLTTDTTQLVGKPAPAIDAKDTEGRPFRISDYQGRFLLVNFFATWCTPCIAEHPQLVAFSQKHARTGDAAIVSVAYNDEPKAVSDFFAKNGGDWAVINDAKSDFSVDYAVIGLPESYLVDPEGTVVHKFTGGVTVADIEREMKKAEKSS